jgi:PEP-CTERM motif
MHLRTMIAASILGCFAATAAHADIVTFTGSTASDPTFVRPLEDLSGSSATTTRYNAYTFSVSASGNYNITSTGTYDTFAVLYSPSFSAGAPLTNAVVANDDVISGPFTTSGFGVSLVQGVSYTLVNTGFLPTSAGAFVTTIAGAGAITPSGPATPPATSPNLLTHAGDTTGKATFDRPIEDLSATSGIGDAVAYDTFHFTVGTSGTYTFLTNGLFDTFDFLYANAFDPLNPLNGVIGDNDDSVIGIGTSGFAAALLAGVDYYLVTTGFSDSDFGLFSTTIGGPGSIAAIPEPDALALMLAGFGVMGYTVRRRKQLRA